MTEHQASASLVMRIRPRWPWRPIDEAPLNERILAAWYDGDVLDEIQLISLVIPKKDYRPASTRGKPGSQSWFNHCSKNYGTPYSLNGWPTHWVYEPDPP